MAARFDRPEGTLRTWVSRARKEGWLGPGSKGRIGAEPGPLLLAWQLEEFKRQHPGVIDHSRRNADGTVTDISEPQHGYHSDDEH
jgi:transposase